MGTRWAGRKLLQIAKPPSECVFKILNVERIFQAQYGTRAEAGLDIVD